MKKLNEKCDCKATLLDSILTELKNNAEPLINKNQIQNNSIDVTERIDFLNADFMIKTFDKACEVSCADFNVKNGFHFGIIDMGFQARDMEKCLHAIRLSQRQNFKTKALTKFSVIERSHELVIIYSETPDDPTIEKLLKAN